MSLKVAVIGAGARGQNAYGQYCLDFPEQINYVAAVDPRSEQLQKISKNHNIAKEMLFTDEDDFYKLGKVCDAVVIANMDKDHYYTILKCLDLGYDILLEKPITPSRSELQTIERKVAETGCKIMVCYVLRYTPFFKKLKDLIDEQAIGEVIGIDHTEYIGNYHMAHSFVRGNWRNSEQSSPIVLQKTSHDLDILTWLVESDYEEVYSYGKLNYFKPENAPTGATEKCINCPHHDCRYNAQRFYLEPLPGGWANNVLAKPTHAGVEQLLANTNYGSCVYKIKDNDVCDHQVALIKFKNGVDVTFTVSAFHQNQSRFVRIMGTEGSIVANTYTNCIQITKLVKDSVSEQQVTEIYPEQVNSGHGGGDRLIMEDFVNFINIDDYQPRTDFKHALQSHYMAYDIEKSRVTNQVVKRETR